MGTNVGFQQFWVTGSRVYFQRDPVNSVEQPIMDFGRIDVANPTINPNIIQLMDSDGGVNRLVAEELTGFTETYDIRFSNLSPDMMAVLMAANPPATFTQAATPVVDVTHWAAMEKLVKVRSATGALVYGLTSIDAIKEGASGSTALVEGTDWETVSLERGIVRMKTSTVHTTDGNIRISYTPRAISGKRLINPQTSGTVRGTGLVVWGRKSNTFQTVREVRMSVSPTGAAFSDSAFSAGTLRCSVLNDPSQPIPAGRILYWLGDLPAGS